MSVLGGPPRHGTLNCFFLFIFYSCINKWPSTIALHPPCLALRAKAESERHRGDRIRCIIPTGLSRQKAFYGVFLIFFSFFLFLGGGADGAAAAASSQSSTHIHPHTFAMIGEDGYVCDR
ncbi:hypothetical protein LY78DRAFT_269165 [Colletotrichum sublineola]|nr:hypothetical protein LY78DRAFT_269165 [Colletotrichum sublineola]